MTNMASYPFTSQGSGSLSSAYNPSRAYMSSPTSASSMAQRPPSFAIQELLGLGAMASQAAAGPGHTFHPHGATHPHHQFDPTYGHYPQNFNGSAGSPSTAPHNVQGASLQHGDSSGADPLIHGAASMYNNPTAPWRTSSSILPPSLQGSVGGGGGARDDLHMGSLKFQSSESAASTPDKLSHGHYFGHTGKK